MISFMISRRIELEMFPNTVGRAIQHNGVGKHSDYHINLDVALGRPSVSPQPPIPRDNPIGALIHPDIGLFLNMTGNGLTKERSDAWLGTSGEFRKLKASVPFAAQFRWEKWL